MTYMARYIAKNVVAAKLASTCTVDLGLDPGRADQVFAYLGPLGGRVDEARLVGAIRKTFPLTPGGAEDLLQLRAPIYREATWYGHFGRGLQDLPWEQVDRVDALRAALGL
jgi:S-adenosylmethionine synthetase